MEANTLSKHSEAPIQLVHQIGSCFYLGEDF